MALSPRVYRNERIAQLRKEITELLGQYELLPSGSKAQSELYMEIEQRYDEIKELKKPHAFERPAGQRIALGTSLALVGGGWLFHSGGVLTFGVFVLFITVLGVMKAPSSGGDAKP